MTFKSSFTFKFNKITNLYSLKSPQKMETKFLNFDSSKHKQGNSCNLLYISAAKNLELACLLFKSYKLSYICFVK